MDLQVRQERLIRERRMELALIDYGSLLRVNGKFINKNCDLFMHSSDTGYVCEQATCSNGEQINIDGNFYVYAGDENFMLCFYKQQFCVISHNKILRYEYNLPFLSETFYFDNLPDVRIDQLDRELRTNYYCSPWDEHDKQFILWQYGYKNGYLKILRHVNQCKKIRKKNYSGRYLATWNYNGNKYEVIFGYGIDPDEEVWNRIKFDGYEFTDVEREIIDRWFSED